MGTYAVIGDVQARFQGFTFSATSKPTQTQTEAWITEAEAMLEGAMLAGGLTVPNTVTRGIEILTSWACDYAEGHVRNALAASANDASNEAGKAKLEAFDARVNWILENSSMAGQMLEGGDAPNAARKVRSYALRNDDNKTISAGDFAPVITKADYQDQY